GAHDDFATACALAVQAATKPSYTLAPFVGITADGSAIMSRPYVAGDAEADADAEAERARFQQERFRSHVLYHSGYYNARTGARRPMSAGTRRSLTPARDRRSGVGISRVHPIRTIRMIRV